MPKLRNATLALLLIASSFSMIFTSPVFAQGATDSGGKFTICSLLGPIGEPFGCSNGGGQFGSNSVVNDYILPRAQLILSLLFIGLILFAIVQVVRAAVVYIQSQGNPDKIGEATKAIRSVFVGLGALFIGIAGILLVLAFFRGGTGDLSGGFDPRCIEQPQCCDTKGTYQSKAGCTLTTNK